MVDDDAHHGFTIRRFTSSTGPGYVQVAASDGRVVNFFDDGNVRLVRPGLILNLSDAHPTSPYVELACSTPQGATSDGVRDRETGLPPALGSSV
jgi:hypothetical protein